MDLQQLFSTALKHRRIIIVGALLGIVVLVLSVYTLSFRFEGMFKWPFSVNTRHGTIYETSISLAVDSPKFGMGRAGLAPNSWQAFERSLDLAPTYSYIASSDLIMDKVEGKIGKLGKTERITSEVIKDTPIFLIKAQSNSSKRTIEIAMATVKELQDYVSETQGREGTPPDDRISIRELGPPTKLADADQFRPLKLSLAFLSPIALAFMMSFIIENFENSRITKS